MFCFTHWIVNQQEWPWNNLLLHLMPCCPKSVVLQQTFYRKKNYHCYFFSQNIQINDISMFQRHKRDLVISKENITKLERNSFRQTARVNVSVMYMGEWIVFHCVLPSWLNVQEDRSWNTLTFLLKGVNATVGNPDVTMVGLKT